MGTKSDPAPNDCYAKAAADEPMFTLLARDPLAPALVAMWAEMRRLTRGPSAKVDEAYACAGAMRGWKAVPPPSPDPGVRTVSDLPNPVLPVLLARLHLWDGLLSDIGSIRSQVSEVADEAKRLADVMRRSARELYAIEVRRQMLGWQDDMTERLVRVQHEMAATLNPAEMVDRGPTTP